MGRSFPADQQLAMEGRHTVTIHGEAGPVKVENDFVSHRQAHPIWRGSCRSLHLIQGEGDQHSPTPKSSIIEEATAPPASAAVLTVPSTSASAPWLAAASSTTHMSFAQ
ncbi:calcineurin-like metallo-phosphoesterase super family protein [Striga asiatica]|uniref:Calcineurin-like metallo-phosphoesterase super family protein n=1 Tax=Striga asiatica TaxID=4170 RepID=A0A5A7QG02_STRAF|nr:calcineurin-like metallo-phosphoesterase super family protein [Striga asiatica]